MKVLVICQYYYPEPFRVTDICENLVLMGYEVTVLSGLPDYPDGKVLKQYRFWKRRKETLNGVNIVRSFEFGRGKNKIKLFLNYISFAISSSFKILFMRKDFDIVIVNQLSPVLMCIPGMIYKKITKRKLYIYCQDLWPESLIAGGVKKDSIIYKISYKISRKIYNFADIIYISSSSFKKYFMNDLKIRNKMIKYLPQYSEDIFKDSNNLDEIISSNDNKEKVYNFVFAGNIGKMQSVETIIMAANQLKERKNIIFHIVGDGSDLDNCKKLSNKMQLENIIYYGRHPVEDMKKYYSMADAMLVTLKSNPIISYTLPGKIQSYMAAAKPIIGAINGETREIINKANCGFCCEAENYELLSKLILKFINSNEKDILANNSLKFYRENYTKSIFFSKLENDLKN